MKINDIKFLPKANAFSDVYGKATGMPFVGEMMVAAAGQESEPTPEPEPDPTPDPEPQYVLQYLNATADCDEDAGCFSPIVQCTILSKEEMTDEEITYGWTFNDGGEEVHFPYDDAYDNHLEKTDGSYLITNENHGLYDVDEQYIGWYWTEYMNGNAQLAMSDEGDEATYTIYLNENSVGSRDIGVTFPICEENCNGEEEAEE